MAGCCVRRVLCTGAPCRACARALVQAGSPGSAGVVGCQRGASARLIMPPQPLHLPPQSAFAQCCCLAASHAAPGRLPWPQFGVCQDCYMPKEPSKQGHRGIGFVTYANPESGERGGQLWPGARNRGCCALLREPLPTTQAPGTGCCCQAQVMSLSSWQPLRPALGI